MASVLTDFFIFTGAYAVVFVGTLMIMNFMLDGFIAAWFRVRTSKGKKVLGIIWSGNRIQYQACEATSKYVKYLDEEKKVVTLTNVKPAAFYRSWKVMAIDIDDVNDCIWIRGQEKIAGGDVRATDSLIERSKMLAGQREKIVTALIIVGIVLALVGAAAAFMSYKANVSCELVAHAFNTSRVI